MERKRKYKKGVATNLLDMCIGSNLEQHRLAQRDDFKCEAVVRETDGLEVGAEQWLKLNKKNLNG